MRVSGLGLVVLAGGEWCWINEASSVASVDFATGLSGLG